MSDWQGSDYDAQDRAHRWTREEGDLALTATSDGWQVARAGVVVADGYAEHASEAMAAADDAAEEATTC